MNATTTAPISLGRNETGALVADFALGIVYHLTDCCGASVTGTERGVSCRSCYKTVDSALGMAWTVADYADSHSCDVCGDSLNWCPQSPLYRRGE